MQVKKIIVLLNVSILIFPLAGCLNTQKRTEVGVLSKPLQEPASGSDVAVAKRFRQTALENPTAVESAIQLSEKYAQLSREAVELRQKNQNLLTENSRLKEQIAAVDAQLRQTKKELSQANDLLINMRIELNNWKTDILGFRDEMRQADTEQLKALIKILKILGGEVAIEANPNPAGPQTPDASDKPKDVSSSAVPTIPANQLELGSEITSTTGEPNE